MLRNFWRNQDLSRKISITMVSLVIVVVIALFTLSYTNQRAVIRFDLEQEAEILLSTLSFAADNDLFVLDVASLQAISEQLTTSELINDVRFYDARGRLVASTQADASQLLSLSADPIGLALIEEGHSSLDWGEESLITGQAIQVGTQIAGAVNIELSTLELNARLQQLAIESFIVGALALALGAVIAVLISRTIANPLRELNDVAHKIAEGNYSQRAAVSSKDEVGELGQTFNSMVASIEKREQELKEARREAQAAQRIAQENSRLKSEFLATMSHELRTPMNAIEGFTSIMMKRMGGVDFNDKTERYLYKVQSNSHRLLGLINDFLDLSRIESGRLELAHLPISPTKMAQSWESNLSSLAEQKSLALEFMVDPDLPETIYGDEESLSKIAVNLIGNAIKFTEEGSVKVSLNRRDEELELVVLDTGIGIPAHARELIFDEFRQVDQSSKRKYGGTGLGLAIVQRLAREMGGSVSLQSTVGAGSMFTVRLPIHTEKQLRTGVA